jgi:hypothetical protein
VKVGTTEEFYRAGWRMRVCRRDANQSQGQDNADSGRNKEHCAGGKNELNVNYLVAIL